MVSTRVVLPEGVAFSYRDLVEQFGESADGKRYELFDGALVLTPSPTTRHQDVCGELFRILKTFAKEHQLGKVYTGPIDVIFDERLVCVPDIAFVASAHSARISMRGIEGAPDLVVEVLSPSTAARDHGVKRDLYGEQGVAEYWVVDPVAETVECYTLRETVLVLDRTLGVDDTLGSPLFPGLEIPVGSIFE